MYFVGGQIQKFCSLQKICTISIEVMIDSNVSFERKKLMKTKIFFASNGIVSNVSLIVLGGNE